MIHTDDRLNVTVVLSNQTLDIVERVLLLRKAVLNLVLCNNFTLNFIILGTKAYVPLKVERELISMN